MGQTLPNRGRDADADYMRVIAAFFVCMSHGSSTRSFAAVAYNCFSRFAVPVFVILSGYYMLSRPQGAGRCLKKTGALLALIFTWSAIFYGYDLLWGVKRWEGLSAFAAYLLTQPVHLWYLWALAALYLFTPAYSLFAAKADRQVYGYILALCFFFGSPVVLAVRSGQAPVLELLLDRMKLPYLLGFPFYYLLGGYFRHMGTDLGGKRNRIVFYAAGVLGMAWTIIGTRLLWTGEVNEFWMSFFAPGLVLSSGAAYFAMKRFFAGRKGGALLRELSDSTLGIYLIHPLVILTIQRSPWNDAFYSGNDRLFVPLRTAAVFVLSALAVTVLRRVPGLRRLVHT